MQMVKPSLERQKYIKEEIEKTKSLWRVSSMELFKCRCFFVVILSKDRENCLFD